MALFYQWSVDVVTLLQRRYTRALYESAMVVNACTINGGAVARDSIRLSRPADTGRTLAPYPLVVVVVQVIVVRVPIQAVV